MTARVLSARELNRATLPRQLLLSRHDLGVVDAVQRLGGLQAQEPRPPFVALWTRLEGFEREQLQRALQAREIVRATAMRATLHALSAEDYLATRAALQPVLTRAMLGALRDRSEGLDLEAVLPVASRLLEERPRAFDELRGLLAAAFPAADPRALGYAVRTHLALVMVPADDRWAFPRNAAFTPAESWLGRPAADAGPRALIVRYLGAFGPASAADAQAWSGLREAGDALEALRPELETFRDQRGRELFDLPDAPLPGEDVPAPARLLPDFDSLLLAHHDRSRLIDDEHRPIVATRNLRIRPTFLHDGRVAGTWSVELRRTEARLELAPFGRLRKRALEELRAEGEALLRFVEPEATSVAVTVA